MDISTGESLLYILIVSILSLLFVFLMIVSSKFNFSNIKEIGKMGEIFVTEINWKKYLKIALDYFIYLVFLLIITIISGITNTFISITALHSIFTSIYLIVYRMSTPLLIFVICFCIFNFFRDIFLNKKIISEGIAMIGRTK